MRVLLVLLMVVGCSSAKQPTATPPATEAGLRPIDAAVVTDAAIDASPPAPIDAAPVEKHVKKATPKPRKPCPACGIGCPHGIPSSKVDENGCSVCACEDIGPALTKP